MRRIKAYRFYRKVAFNLYLFRQSLRISPKRETCDNIFIFEGITPMALKAFDQYVPNRASLYVSRLPDARDQSEANSGCVFGVAG